MDFTESHIEHALSIAKANYEKERKSVPILPEFVEFPNFSVFSKNGLGVSAFDDNRMVGYLCCYEPFKKALIIYPAHGNIFTIDKLVKNLRKNKKQNMVIWEQ